MGIATLVLSSLLVLGQVKGEFQRGSTEDRPALNPGKLTDTFFVPSGRYLESPGSIESDGVKLFRERYAVASQAPSYFANSTLPAKLVLFISDDYEFDLEKVAMHCRQLTAVKVGNLILQGDTARAAGDELVVEGKEVKLLRVSPNRLAPPVEEMRGHKISINLKTYTAKSDSGSTKTFAPPTESQPRPRTPPLFDE